MDTSYLGEIQIFAFNFAPRNWATCEGQILPITSNTSLFSLLGNEYGGDGKATFGLPDLRGRVAVGQGTSRFNMPYPIGMKSGTETIILDLYTMPAHTHLFTAPQAMASSKPGTQPNPSASVNTLATFNDAALSATNNVYNDATPDTELSSGTLSYTVGSTGNGLPFSIKQPTLGLTYCICTSGLYPPRS